MGVKFFGQFLLERKVISPEELSEAIEYQEQRYIDFGDCAIAKGYITKEDLVKLKNQQKEVDLRFGEIAVKLHLMTPAQVEEILSTQKSDNIYIGEALAKKGFLTIQDVERELTLFRDDQRQYSTKEDLVPEGIRNPEIVKEIVILTQKLFNRVARLNVKVDNGIICSEEPDRDFLVVSLSLRGAYQCDYCLSLSETLSREVTSAIIGETVKDDATDLIIDGVKEFCNIVCGNIIAKLSDKGTIIEISTPRHVEFKAGSYNLVMGRNTICYSLATAENRGTLYLIEC